jgi:hypothetical protein
MYDITLTIDMVTSSLPARAAMRPREGLRPVRTFTGPSVTWDALARGLTRTLAARTATLPDGEHLDQYATRE